MTVTGDDAYATETSQFFRVVCRCPFERGTCCNSFSFSGFLFVAFVIFAHGPPWCIWQLRNFLQFSIVQNIMCHCSLPVARCSVIKNLVWLVLRRISSTATCVCVSHLHRNNERRRQNHFKFTLNWRSPVWALTVPTAYSYTISPIKSPSRSEHGALFNSMKMVLQNYKTHTHARCSAY